MIRANQYRFYALGAKVHPLTQYHEKLLTKDVFWPLWEARVALGEALKENQFRVCKAGTDELISVITGVIPEKLAEASAVAQHDDTPIGLHAHLIRQSAASFEIVLAAELQVTDTYLVTQKGNYSTPDLIDNGDWLIPEEMRKDLSGQAVLDLRAAGRCLAFSLPTATGFHILRATEAVIQQYYTVVIGRPPGLKVRNWGAYVQCLRKAEADRKIVDFIDHIRDQYRNPTLHADDNLSIEDAQVFVGICVSAIYKIIVEIQRLRALMPTP